MSERRKHERVQREVSFHCYIDGQRFDSASVNISSGGAFLKTPDLIPPDSVVVVVPKQQFLTEFPVMLVGKVLRRDESKGLGITWLRCVTRSGLRRLWQFIETFPELWETIPPLPSRDIAGQACIGYDFGSRQFFLPKGEGGTGGSPKGRSSARKRPAQPARPAAAVATAPIAAPVSATVHQTPVPVSEPRVDPSFAGKATSQHHSTTVYARSTSHAPEVVRPRSAATAVREPTPPPVVPTPEASARVEHPSPYRRTSSSGAITQVIQKQEEEFPANISVICQVGNDKYEARARMISLNTLFILSFDQELFDVEKMDVHMPVTLHDRTYPVTLSCHVLRTGQHVDAGGPGIHMRISAVFQPQRPGIFERYVKFLYYQNVTGRY
jgi:hypothetical protein